MKQPSLTSGSVARGLFSFLIPLMLGQLLQQLYNVADAWVIGNFADNASFAAVTSCGNLAFLIVGFFIGLSNGAGVVIARHFGAKDQKRVENSIRTTIVLGIIASIFITIITTALAPQILIMMKTPDSVLEYAITYFRVYCMGISTVIMYNLFMAIMRALGDSISPLMFLCVSSVINVILDLIFVAGMHIGVFGAALATVIAQGISAILCFIRMQRKGGYFKVSFAQIHIDTKAAKEIIMQGLPTGIQNSALSLGNIVVQSHINSFGEYAMAGQGAHAKIEGFVFIPVISISMALATFVSQNRGAGKWDRVKKGSIYGLVSSMLIAQGIGVIINIYSPVFLRFFTSSSESIKYGVSFAKIVTVFYFILAFAHAASGVMQGLGKSLLSMISMLSFWCIFRIIYVTIALNIRHDFRMIAFAYPITWMLSDILFVVFLIKAMKGKRNKK